MSATVEVPSRVKSPTSQGNGLLNPPVRLSSAKTPAPRAETVTGRVRRSSRMGERAWVR
jgi:hypothetical protein